MMGPYACGGGWMAFGWFTMLLFWAFVIVGIIALVRWATTRTASSGSHAQAETPLEILKRRYASGEITKEQYEAMKRDVA